MNLTPYHAKYFAYDLTRLEITEDDYNLNIPRYVNTFEEEEEIDPMAVRSI
jgi:type I restriction enzyme M protein